MGMGNPTKSERSKKGRRSARPRLTLCFFGFAFSRAANDMAYDVFSSVGSFGPVWGDDMLSLSMMAMFLVCALLARKIAPLYCKRPVVAAAGILSIASAVLAYLAPYCGAGTVGVSTVALALAGLSGAAFVLLWAEFHSTLEPACIVLYVSGAFALGSWGAWLLEDLDPLRTMLVLCALPMASIACLKASFSRVEEIDLLRKAWGRFTFPWRLILVLGVYEFAYGVREAMATFSWGSYILGVIIVSLSLFFLVLFLSHRFNFSVVYQTPFVLMVGGLAMVPLTAPANAFASDLLISAGYALMFLVLTFLLCDLSHRYGVSVLVLCGVQELTAVFRLAGHRVPPALDAGMLPPALDATTISVVLTVAVVVASALLLTSRELSGRWGATFFGVDKMAAEAEHGNVFHARCGEIAEAHNLSAREREVFEHLAAGMSPSAIERKLFIANGTLKSHTQRIYQKLGIHSRKELRQMVGFDEEDVRFGQ